MQPQNDRVIEAFKFHGLLITFQSCILACWLVGEQTDKHMDISWCAGVHAWAVALKSQDDRVTQVINCRADYVHLPSQEFNIMYTIFFNTYQDVLIHV